MLMEVLLEEMVKSNELEGLVRLHEVIRTLRLFLERFSRESESGVVSKKRRT